MADPADLLENKRIQLVHGLTNVADSMRQCAIIAEQYAKLFSDSPDKPLLSAKRKSKALETDGEGTTRKRRTKKVRDPNEPKRPASSYIMFQNDVRRELKTQFPDMTQADLLAMISRQWADMSEEQKAVYSQANASAKERYSAEKAAYIAGKQSGGQVLPAPPVVVPATPATPAPPTVKKPVAVPKTPKSTTKAQPKSAPIVAASASTSSGSEEESDDDEEEGDDDDDDDDEVEAQRPAPKKAKTAASTTHREKKQSK